MSEEQAVDVRILQARYDRQSAELIALKHGGGGGTSGPMDPAVPMKDYVDARDEAIESRLTAKLDQLSTKGTIWGAAATVIAIILAVLAFGGDRFDSGLNISGTLQKSQEEQRATDARQDARLQQIDGKLDLLIQRTGADIPKP